jgi:hypothetical protein
MIGPTAAFRRHLAECYDNDEEVVTGDDSTSIPIAGQVTNATKCYHFAARALADFKNFLTIAIAFNRDF